MKKKYKKRCRAFILLYLFFLSFQIPAIANPVYELKDIHEKLSSGWELDHPSSAFSYSNQEIFYQEAYDPFDTNKTLILNILRSQYDPDDTDGGPAVGVETPVSDGLIFILFLITCYFLYTKRKQKMKLNVFLLLAFICSGMAVQAQQSPTITPKDNPSLVVKMGDALDFAIDIYNPSGGSTYNDATLSVTIPSGWKFISAPGYTTQANGTNKINVTIPFLDVNSTINLVIRLQPVCESVAGTGKVNYEFQKGAVSLATASTLEIGKFADPVLLFTHAPSQAVDLNQPVQQIWTLEQTAVNSYVTNLQVTIAALTDAVVLSNLEVWTGTAWEELSVTINKTATSYSYLLDNSVISKASADGKLKYGDLLKIRETVKYTNCDKSGDMKYAIVYGDATAYCPLQASAQGTTTLSVFSPAYSPDIINFKTAVAPLSKTGDGTFYYKISNLSNDPNSKLKDIQLLLYNNDLSQYDYKEVYFTDVNGVRISGAPAITMTNNTAIGVSPIKVNANPKIWVVNFDNMTQSGVSTIPNCGLADLDGDGKYNDLPPIGSDNNEKAFYIAVKWNVNFDTKNKTEGDCFATANANVLAASTRFAYVYYKNACAGQERYIRSYSNTTSMADVTTNTYMGGVGASTPSLQAIIDPVNVKSGDLTTLTITTSAYESSVGWASNNPGYTYTAQITIPDGFIFDKTKHVVKYEGNVVNSNNITVSPDGKTLVFIVPRAPRTLGNRYVITMDATTEVATVKEVSLSQTFQIPGNDIIYYGCTKLPVSFQQILAHQGMTMNSFEMERTTFGFKSSTDFSKADRTVPGIRLDRAGPYDNVSMKGAVSFGPDFTMNGDHLWVVVSYSGKQGADNFYFQKQKAVITYTESATGITTTKEVDTAGIISGYTEISGAYMHQLKLDLSKYIGVGNFIPNLNGGDIVEVEFKTQTTENPIPKMLSLVPELGMQIYLDNADYDADKNKLAKNFFLVDYKITDLRTNTSNQTPVLADRTKDAITVVGFYHSSGLGSEVLFPNEYRPNDQLLQYDLTYSSLIYPSQAKFRDGEALTSSQYSYSYTDCFTSMTFNNFTQKQSYSAVLSGGYFPMNISMDLIVFKDNITNGSAHVILYPTSENPKDTTVQVGSTRKFDIALTDYNYAISSVHPNISPVGATASWDIQIANKSSWANAIVAGATAPDPILPNTWLSVEFSSGKLTNLALYDETGTTKVGDLTKYAEGKYWILLGDISVPVNKKYTLKTGYTECDPNTVVNATVSMGISRLQAVKNPWDGFDFGLRGTSTICRSVSQSLSLTPKSTEFTPTVTDPMALPNGKYEFCEFHTFTANFNNSLEGQVTNLSLKVKLPIGMIWDNNTPLVKKGNGAYVAITGTATIDADNNLIIPVDGFLDSYVEGDVNPDAHIYVQFNLKPECGFTSGRPVYMEFSGTNGCGTQITRPSNSSSIHIDGLRTDLPDIALTDVTINGTDATSNPLIIPYQSATDNAVIDIVAHFNYASNPVDGVYAYVDIPENLTYDGSGTLTPAGGSPVTFSYYKDPETNADVKTRLIAPIDKPTLPQSGGLNYTIDIRLTPDSPEKWDCSEKDIYVSCVVVSSLECNGTQCPVPAEISGKKSKIQLQKESLVSFSNVSVTGQPASATTETITLKGTVSRPYGSTLNDVFVSLYVDKTGNGFTSDDTKATGTTSAKVTFPAGENTYSFTATFTVKADEVCKLMAVIVRADNPYLCSDLVSAIGYIGFQLSPLTVCQGTSISAGSISMTGYSYSWTNPAYGSLSSNSIANPTYCCTSNPPVGQKVTLNLTVNRSGGCLATASEDITITPLKSTWTGAGIINDWHDYRNWDNGIPGLCTDVIVAGNAAGGNYPVLSDEVANECNTIYFKHGGEVAQTNNLTYTNGAKVDLTLSGSRWYMTASPLEEMYRGDFWAAPFGTTSGTNYTRVSPKVFMRHYQSDFTVAGISSSVAKWSDAYNNLDIVLPGGKGYTTWVSIAPTAKQTFTFPRPETEYEYFTIVDAGTSSTPATDTPNGRKEIVNKSTLKTDHNEYFSKLVYDNDFSGTLSLSANAGYETILIGNPFMSHLDFNKFISHAANASSFENGYYIWNGAGTFEAITGSYATASNGIAPMQSFVLKKKNGITANVPSVAITPEMSVVNAGTILRNASDDNFINVEVQRDGERQSSVVIAYKQGVSNAYNSSKDMQTLFSETVKSPAVLYSVTGNNATSIRTIGNLEEPIALAIRTTDVGNLTLALNETSTLPYPVYLEDRALVEMIDLRKTAYTFYNSSGNIENRFYLRISNQMTGFENLTVSGLTIYTDNGEVHASSIQDDPIRSIEVIGLQGQYLFKQTGLNTSTVSCKLSFGQKIVIVRVKTDKTQKTEKVLVKWK